MTLSSRHRIRNSSPGGLRPSTLPLGHGGSPQYWLSHVDGEETFFVFFKPPRPGTEPRTLAWKAAVLTTTLGPPPCSEKKSVNTKHLYDFIQCWTNVEDVGPTLYKCYTNVLCLLGSQLYPSLLWIPSHTLLVNNHGRGGSKCCFNGGPTSVTLARQ